MMPAGREPPLQPNPSHPEGPPHQPPPRLTHSRPPPETHHCPCHTDTRPRRDSSAPERRGSVCVIQHPSTIYMAANSNEDGGLLSQSATLVVFRGSSPEGGMLRNV